VNTALERALLERLSPDGHAFFSRAIEQASTRAWGQAYALAGHKLVAEGPLGAIDELAELAWLWRDVPAAELVRIALLMRVCQGGTAPNLLSECFRQGDNGEKRAVLRSLVLMPEPAELCELASVGCRTNVVTVFEAIACENPFPARYLPEASFNQMVLKCAFVGLPLARVMGLDERRNADLARMAGDYAAERRAAGRSVPSDLNLILEGGRP
jgi:hypothetical protein